MIRRKNGLTTHHPLFGPELRALRQLKWDYPDTDYIFMTERKAPITGDTVRKIVASAGEKAALGMPIHPHMLRHSTGFKLANDGVATRSIQHTVRYTEIASIRFREFWDD